ncbi:MAG: glycosyltransferase family 39 protein [Terracidiphilus sp.]|jgi:4-amino-4-deoxy-L-arabinose transferase-like glycosyltransferase
MVLIAFAIRLAVIPFVYDEWMEPTRVTHWEQGNIARALVAGQGFGSPLPSIQPSAMMTPVFPMVVAVFFRIFGVHTLASILAILSFNSLLSSLACIPVLLMARRSFGPRVALWAGWGWAFSPYGIYFSAEWAWSTHLLLLCLCWLLYLAQDLERSPKLALWAAFGLLAGFAGLTEPAILSIIPFLLVLAAWRLAHAGKRWFLPGVVASLSLAAALSPWIIRNAVVFHRFIPMRDSMGMELLIGNNGYSQHWVNCEYCPMHNARELAEYNSVGELAYMSHKSRQAKTFIRDNPRWFVWMCGRRALYLWTGYWSFDHDYLLGEPLDPFNIPVATSLSLLAFLGVFFAWRRNPHEAMRYGVVLLIYPLMYYFVNPGAYRLRPIDPVIVILGSYAILRLFKRVGEDALPGTIPSEEIVVPSAG